MRITVGKKKPTTLRKNILKELYIAQISSESELLKWWVVKKTNPETGCVEKQFIKLNVLCAIDT